MSDTDLLAIKLVFAGEVLLVVEGGLKGLAPSLRLR
jgi:hypothetical protein